jgi:hypothetical protein
MRAKRPLVNSTSGQAKATTRGEKPTEEIVCRFGEVRKPSRRAQSVAAGDFVRVILFVAGRLQTGEMNRVANQLSRIARVKDEAQDAAARHPAGIEDGASAR